MDRILECQFISKNLFEFPITTAVAFTCIELVGENLSSNFSTDLKKNNWKRKQNEKIKQKTKWNKILILVHTCLRD